MADKGKTVITLEGDVKTALRTSAGVKYPDYSSSAEVRNASKAFIAQTRYAITRSALMQAIGWREDEAEGKDPRERGSKRHFLDYTFQTGTKVTSGDFSMHMSISDQNLTLVSKDGTEKLNVKEAFAEEKEKYLDSGKSVEELKVLLEQHKKAAAKINAASGRERIK